MANAFEVTDHLSNTEEHIERAAKTIGRSPVRRKILEAIYHHKKKQKSVSEIVTKTRIKRMRVLQIGQDFCQKNLVRKTTIDGEIAYGKIDTFQAHKTKILELAGNAKKIANFPTKRKNSIAGSITIRIPTSQANAERLTIDDLASFDKVKKIQTKISFPRR